MDLRLRKEVLDFLHYVCDKNLPEYTPDPVTRASIRIKASDLVNKITSDNVLVRGIYIPKAKLDQWISSIKSPKTGTISPRIRAIKEVRITYNLPLSEAKALIDEIINNDDGY